MRYYVDLFFQYLMRKKYLHKTVGYLTFTYLVYELGTPKLSQDVLPNYKQIKQDYGQFSAMILNYVIDKNANGADSLTVTVLFLILFYCIYVEKKINSIKSGNRNNFFGLFQNINQTFNGDK